MRRDRRCFWARQTNNRLPPSKTLRTHTGRHLLNYTDFRLTDIRHLLHNISVVSQSPALSDANIAENISYENKDKDASQSDRLNVMVYCVDYIIARI